MPRERNHERAVAVAERVLRDRQPMNLTYDFEEEARAVLAALVTAGYLVVQPTDTGLAGLLADCLAERDRALTAAGRLADALKMARGFLGMAVRSPRSAAWVADEALREWEQPA